jgi:A/G-specific adenine glycosylase
MAKQFTDLLLEWDQDLNDRLMPWKGEKDPYKIWLSEIILQQTRVEQGWAYYEKFITQFPTIFDLAKAKEEKVFKLWEGLGYYNRCRNLLFTAKLIVQKYNGVFPSTYEDLIALKGVGPYTASAIASFAFNLPHAVVDGNVYRVLARFYGIDTPIDSKEGMLQFNQVAFDNLSQKFPGKYNQALMDFGATVCKPALPICNECVLQKKCVAFSLNKVNQLPVKIKSIQKKKRNFDFYCFEFEGNWLIQKRTAKDIWQDLHQFYLVEQDAFRPLDQASIMSLLNHQLAIPSAAIHLAKIRVFSPYKQQLTHQTIQARFIVVPLKKIPSVLTKSNWVNLKQLQKLAFPKLLNEFLQSDFQKI